MEKINMKVLYGYNYYPADNTYGDIRDYVLNYLKALTTAGFDIEPFCLSIDPPSFHMGFSEIDRKWKTGDKKLLSLYESLEKAVDGKDVFFNSPGIHLHPDFVEKLPVFTVFGCNDDPESSEYLSKPVAAAYDLCLIGNIAEIDTYKSWGVKHVEWLPMGLYPQIYDHSLSYNDIINETDRNIDIFMLIDKTQPLRKDRLEKMDRAFPNAHFYGNGWRRGYLPAKSEIEFLRHTKIGPNFHLSTGPINYRTFYLPANGVMQICDNKSHLGLIYELGKEVVGFETVEECIDLCNYYLHHDDERRKIAADGWKRTITDYNQVSVFTNFFIGNVKKYINSSEYLRNKEYNIIAVYRKKNFIKLFLLQIIEPCIYYAKKLYLKTKRRAKLLMRKETNE